MGSHYTGIKNKVQIGPDFLEVDKKPIERVADVLKRF